jgi:hypothetical protein
MLALSCLVSYLCKCRFLSGTLCCGLSAFFQHGRSAYRSWVSFGPLTHLLRFVFMLTRGYSSAMRAVLLLPSGSDYQMPKRSLLTQNSNPSQTIVQNQFCSRYTRPSLRFLNPLARRPDGMASSWHRRRTSPAKSWAACIERLPS